MKTLAILILETALLVSLTQCKSPAPKEFKATEPPKLEVAELSSPAGPGSGEPNVSAGPDSHVYLSWIDSADKMNSLKFSTLAENQMWSPAATIAQGEHWFVNPSDFPSLIALPDGTLAAHWLADNADGTEAYNVNLSLSHDSGKSWSKPIVPHRDRSANQHGFVSLIAAGPSELGIIWLDGAKIKDDVGDMALVFTTIGTDGKPGKETSLDNRVCECCQTSAAMAPGGIVAVYRDRTAKEIRDISIVRSTKDGWSQPETLSQDNWMIDGCPVNGPSISTAGENAAVAWFTSPDDMARVNVVLSHDGAKTFGSPIRVDDGMPNGRVGVVALPAGGAFVSWLEQTDKGTQVHLREVQADGTLNKTIVASGGSRASFTGVPRIARSGNRIVIAWTDKETPAKVHTGTLKLD